MRVWTMTSGAERSVEEIVRNFFPYDAIDPIYGRELEKAIIEALTTERTARVEKQNQINLLEDEVNRQQAKLLDVEKKLICSECGGTDSVCAKAWLKQRDELQTRLSLALKVLKAQGKHTEECSDRIEGEDSWRCTCPIGEVLASFDQTGGSA